jgi:hypothetical protein
MNAIALLETVRSINTIVKTEVVQIGIGSVIHIAAANKKIAITRCSKTVGSPLSPNALAGKNHANSPIARQMPRQMSFLLSVGTPEGADFAVCGSDRDVLSCSFGSIKPF